MSLSPSVCPLRFQVQYAVPPLIKILLFNIFMGKLCNLMMMMMMIIHYGYDMENDSSHSVRDEFESIFSKYHVIFNCHLST